MSIGGWIEISVRTKVSIAWANSNAVGKGKWIIVINSSAEIGGKKTGQIVWQSEARVWKISCLIRDQNRISSSRKRGLAQ